MIEGLIVCGVVTFLLSAGIAEFAGWLFKTNLEIVHNRARQTNLGENPAFGFFSRLGMDLRGSIGYLSPLLVPLLVIPAVAIGLDGILPDSVIRKIDVNNPFVWAGLMFAMPVSLWMVLIKALRETRRAYTKEADRLLEPVIPDSETRAKVMAIILTEERYFANWVFGQGANSGLAKHGKDPFNRAYPLKLRSLVWLYQQVLSKFGQGVHQKSLLLWQLLTLFCWPRNRPTWEIDPELRKLAADREIANLFGYLAQIHRTLQQEGVVIHPDFEFSKAELDALCWGLYGEHISLSVGKTVQFSGRFGRVEIPTSWISLNGMENLQLYALLTGQREAAAEIIKADWKLRR